MRRFEQKVRLLLFLLTLCGCAGAEIETEAVKSLEGIWVFAQPQPAFQHTVSIVQDAGDWTVEVDKAAVKAEYKDDNLLFSLANGQSFQGRFLTNGNLEGTWFQPAPDYGFYSSMATIVSLPSVSDSTWQGVVTLQPRPFHLFLDIFQSDDGRFKAALRNPERNDVFGATLYDLELRRTGGKKQHWRLVGKRNGREITVPFTYSTEGVITLEHYVLPEPAEFSRAGDDRLARYYSRMPAEVTSKHKPVAQMDDGWEVTDAAKAGFNTQKLDALVAKLAGNDPRESRPQLLHSVLVSHRGKLVVEEYFYGHSASSVHDTRSLAKVFGSILVGAAQQQGYAITHEYKPLPAVFKKHGVKVPKAAREITLGHFLSYTSGLDSAEDDRSPGSENALWAQQREDFWLYTAKLPILHPPGERYGYSSASANMAGAALEQVTGQSVRAFFHETIAKPLDFAPYHWNLTPYGKSYLGGGVYVRPRDLLKLGAVYAAKGVWQGRQIVPAAWVSFSTQPKIDINPQTTGLTQEDFNNLYFGGKQAYNWLVEDLRVGDKTYASYAAMGNGGQILAVVPKLDLAVVMTGGNYRMGSIWGRWRQQIIGDSIIPALLNGQGKR